MKAAGMKYWLLTEKVLTTYLDLKKQYIQPGKRKQKRRPPLISVLLYQGWNLVVPSLLHRSIPSTWSVLCSPLGFSPSVSVWEKTYKEAICLSYKVTCGIPCTISLECFPDCELGGRRRGSRKRIFWGLNFL